MYSFLIIKDVNLGMLSKVDVSQWIPKQNKGKLCDSLFSVEIDAKSSPNDEFETFKKRLFNINSWAEYSGREKAEFSHVDIHGNALDRDPSNGDLIKIKVPGLFNFFESGYDWVQIQNLEIKNNSEAKWIVFQLIPCTCPNTSNKNIAHFLTNDSSNTFILIEKLGIIQFSVHGRNELPNCEKTKFWHRCRNKLVANGGFLGLSKMQWQSLVEGLLQK